MNLKKSLVALGVAVLLTVGIVHTSSAAVADTPPVPVAEFNAELCEGTTVEDPTDAQGPVPDLTRVWGARLADYNEGNVVILYDSFGGNEWDGYPPVCGVRYVDGIGAVSEWMFCTDYHSHVCSGVDEDGNLLDIDGVPIAGLDEFIGPNSKLTAQEEKIVTYLITHGQQDYEGVGYFNWADRAVVDGTSQERNALQVLVWCISDPVNPEGADATEMERLETCSKNMNGDRQGEILATFDGEASLTLTGPAAPLNVGETAQFTITTDITTAPLTVSTSGAAGTLTVVSGEATLNGSTLTLTGTTPEQTVVLGFTATEAGTVVLVASAFPATTDSIGWNQSPGISADEVPCQIYATFRTDDRVVVSGEASAEFVDDVAPTPTPTVTETPTPTPTESSTPTPGPTATVAPSSTPKPSAAQQDDLAKTGADAASVSAIALGIGAVLVGSCLLWGSRRKKSADA